MKLEESTVDKLTIRERVALKLILLAIELVYPPKWYHKWEEIRDEIIEESNK